jgi:DNA polymerase/3'-5' exonuclease PolX
VSLFHIPKLGAFNASSSQVEEVAKKVETIKESQRKTKLKGINSKPCLKFLF